MIKLTHHPDPYVNLANAVVQRAVEDYRDKWKTYQLTKALEPERNRQERENIENFFQSDWFKALTNLDGATLLQRMKEQ